MAYVIDVIGEKASNILKDQETRKFPMHPTVPRKMIWLRFGKSWTFPRPNDLDLGLYGSCQLGGLWHWSQATMVSLNSSICSVISKKSNLSWTRWDARRKISPVSVPVWKRGKSTSVETRNLLKLIWRVIKCIVYIGKIAHHCPINYKTYFLYFCDTT